MSVPEHGAPRIIANDRLDLASLRGLAERPAPFAPHESRFWDDPYIATQMLAAHLDPTTDAASRRPETIERSVDWLVGQLGLRPGQRILDLGCGPGLYAIRLARRGLAVVGVDLSANSLDYARRATEREGLPIEYVELDYRELDYAGRFDAALLIYFDLGVLSNADRDEVLARVHRALRPGGAFAFDVRTPKRPAPPDGTRIWSVSLGGFWKPGPYVELTEYFQYAAADADLRQTIVVEADGQVSLYRIWEHYYTLDGVTAALEAAGFRVESAWTDLTGQPYDPDAASLGLIARRV